MKLLSRCFSGSSRSGGLGGSRSFRSRSISFRSLAAADEAEAESKSDSGERDANDIHVFVSLLFLIAGS
jgi:hypothetical protein